MSYKCNSWMNFLREGLLENASDTRSAVGLRPEGPISPLDRLISPHRSVRLCSREIRLSHARSHCLRIISPMVKFCELIMYLIYFLRKSPPDQDTDELFPQWSSFVNRSSAWSIFFINPYLTKIQTNYFPKGTAFTNCLWLVCSNKASTRNH